MDQLLEIYKLVELIQILGSIVFYIVSQSHTCSHLGFSSFFLLKPENVFSMKNTLAQLYHQYTQLNEPISILLTFRKNSKILDINQKTLHGMNFTYRNGRICFLSLPNAYLLLPLIEGLNMCCSLCQTMAPLPPSTLQFTLQTSECLFLSSLIRADAALILLWQQKHQCNFYDNLVLNLLMC